jgi:hypothetical protein
MTQGIKSTAMVREDTHHSYLNIIRLIGSVKTNGAGVNCVPVTLLAAGSLFVWMQGEQI